MNISLENLNDDLKKKLHNFQKSQYVCAHDETETLKHTSISLSKIKKMTRK